jgi:hypothetical protein
VCPSDVSLAEAASRDSTFDRYGCEIDNFSWGHMGGSIKQEPSAKDGELPIVDTSFKTFLFQRRIRRD